MKKFFLAMTAVVALLLATATPADAIFRLRVENVDTGHGVTISDDTPGDAFNPLPNVISNSVMIDGIVINSATGFRSPLLPTPGFFDGIDLNDISVTVSGSANVRIFLVADGFNNAPNGGVVLNSIVGGTIDAPAGSTATFDSWANAGNAIPLLGADTGGTPVSLVPVTPAIPGGSTIAPTLAFSVPPGGGITAFSGATSVNFTKTGPYSLFSRAVIHFTGAGSASFNHNTATNPAPAGLVLLVAGAPFLALGYYRRKKAAVQA